METTIITTADGSHTLYSAQFNEIYHSRHGAIAESEHVFIIHGLAPMQLTSLNVFEVGFGTGLNALLALRFAIHNKRTIHYKGIELFPLDKDTVAKLNYACMLHDEISATYFQTLHQCPWNETHQIHNFFCFEKNNLSLFETSLPENFFDVIFFDAFAPAKQPEMWEPEVFKKLFHATKSGGRLTTYCSKSDVRRAMELAGFKVQKKPGPPGKREMLVALKTTA